MGLRLPEPPRFAQADQAASIEERYEALHAVMRLRWDAAIAMHRFIQPGPDESPGTRAFRRSAWINLQLAECNIDWEEIEQVSRPFLFDVEPMRRALTVLIDALATVAEERYRYLPDDQIVPEATQAIAAYKELRALPERPFVARPERFSAHALALYELIAPKILPARRRGRRWSIEPQPYNEEAMRLVRQILAHHYYGPSVPNIRARLLAARKAQAR